MTIYTPGFIPITWGAFNGLWDKVTHMRTCHQSPKFNFLHLIAAKIEFHFTRQNQFSCPCRLLKLPPIFFSICAPIWAGLAFAVYCPIPRKHSTPVVGCRCSLRKCSGTRVQKTIKNTKELREAGHEQNSNFDTDDLFIAFGKYPQSYWRQIYCLAGLYETDKNLFCLLYCFMNQRCQDNPGQISMGFIGQSKNLAFDKLNVGAMKVMIPYKWSQRVFTQCVDYLQNGVSNNFVAFH